MNGKNGLSARAPLAKLIRRRGARGAVVALLLGALAGCGSGGQNAVVVRVGGQVITKRAVDHWADVIRRGGAFAGSRGEPARGDSEQRALALLISSNALIDEAADKGFAVPAEAVDLALHEREEQVGSSQFRQHLEATGQTAADVKFELEAELALGAMHQDMERRAMRVTPAEIADFYSKNRELFRPPELRVVDFKESLPSRQAATAFVRRVGAGQRFTEAGFRELVPRPLVATGRPDKIQLVRAIFSARTGVVSSPLRFFSAWTVFVVRKIIPQHGNPRPFAEVRGEAAERLAAVRRRTIEAQLDTEYRERWLARVQCRAGYIAPGCARYRGRLGSYEDPFASDLTAGSLG